MDLVQFEQLLKDHDWAYQRADDFRKWTKGSNERSVITTYANILGTEAQELYETYKAKYEPKG